MSDRLKLTEEKKAQLLRRVKEALDEDLLEWTDWMKMYEILVNACDRKANALYEDYLTESLKGGDEG